MSNAFDYSPPTERDTIIPRFFMNPVRNNFESEKQGREVWEEVPYVEMFVPGDKNATPVERVKPSHKERWPRQWDAFEKSVEAPEDGTPLAEWAAMSRAQVIELSSVHVRTVEQLASLSDTQLAKAVPMGGHALRARAKAWLEQAEQGAPLAEANQRIETLEQQIKVLTDQLAAKPAPKPEED